MMLRGLETLNARANSYLKQVIGYEDDANPAEAAADIVIRRGFKGKRIAIDQNAWFLTVNLFQMLRRKLGRLEDGSGIVERLRRVKSPLELDDVQPIFGEVGGQRPHRLFPRLLERRNRPAAFDW